MAESPLIQSPFIVITPARSNACCVLGINSPLFVDLTSDAPVCGKVDEDGVFLLSKFGQTDRV